MSEKRRDSKGRILNDTQMYYERILCDEMRFSTWKKTPLKNI